MGFRGLRPYQPVDLLLVGDVLCRVIRGPPGHRLVVQLVEHVRPIRVAWRDHTPELPQPGDRVLLISIGGQRGMIVNHDIHPVGISLFDDLVQIRGYLGHRRRVRRLVVGDGDTHAVEVVRFQGRPEGFAGGGLTRPQDL